MCNSSAEQKVLYFACVPQVGATFIRLLFFLNIIISGLSIGYFSFYIEENGDKDDCVEDQPMCSVIAPCVYAYCCGYYCKILLVFDQIGVSLSIISCVASIALALFVDFAVKSKKFWKFFYLILGVGGILLSVASIVCDLIKDSDKEGFSRLNALLDGRQVVNWFLQISVVWIVDYILEEVRRVPRRADDSKNENQTLME